jgi:hypothetical protein
MNSKLVRLSVGNYGESLVKHEPTIRPTLLRQASTKELGNKNIWK